MVNRTVPNRKGLVLVPPRRASGRMGRSTGPYERAVYLVSVPNRGSRIRPGGPKAYLREGTWPDGQLHADSPVAVYWAAEVSRRLAAALKGRSKRAFALEAGLARSTIYVVLSGETWVDLATLGTLEEFLATDLFPRWPNGATGPDADR